MHIIEQSTSITIRIGPFLDETNGRTAETALTISQADIRLSKNGAAFAQTNDTGGATHDENGWYYLTLDATDTGTLGRLLVAIHESGALPVWREFMVVPSNVWDSIVGGTDYLLVDTYQIEGVDATNQINTEVDTALSDIKLDHLIAVAESDDPVDNSIIAKLAASDGDWSGFDGSTDSLEAIRDRGDAAWTSGAGSGLTPLASGTAQSGGNDTIQLASAETFANDELNGNVVKVTSGTGAGQARLITDYVGSTDTATVTPNWITNPDATSVYEVVPGSVNVEQIERVNATDQINTEVDTALSDIKLDHLIAVAESDDPVDNSIIAKLAANDGDWSGFDESTDSLEAIRDRGDAAWTSGAGSGLTPLASGTAQSGGNDTIQLSAGETFANDELNGNVVKITSGTGAGQARLITDYVGSTDTATVTPNWTTNPDATSVYEIVEGSMNVEQIERVDATNQIRDAVVDDATRIDASALNTLSGNDPGSQLAAQSDITGLNDPTAAAIADAVWDEQSSGHVDAGKAGAQLWTDIDAILVDTGTDGVVLADNAITAAKIATGAISDAELSAAACNKIADHTIRRTFQNACDSANGDTKTGRSLLGAIGKLVNKISITGSTLTITEDDDTTALFTQAITTDSGVDPITALDTD